MELYSTEEEDTTHTQYLLELYIRCSLESARVIHFEAEKYGLSQTGLVND